MNMHWSSYIISGFVATLVLTTSLSLSRGLGLTRMDFSLMLGTVFTYNRDVAKTLGFVLHFVFGWIFSLMYILIFMEAGKGWYVWLGLVLGLLHGMFLLTVGMWLLPSMHPRMASEDAGPEPTRQLEPPGYLALNYGSRTPLATVLAHVIYGGILGLLYR
jgi:hypothetical protein